MDQAVIRHLPEQHCFVLDFAGHQARLDYQLATDASGDAVQVNFTHTFVPEAARGQGLAEQLVRAGLSWARAQQLQIVASCWYVAKFLR
ncbi:MAG TPA: N-acetyltransferase [Rheinheimera sp.]|uniref:GNAT family N-acetyltransferase n=1 Tax=Rheinheimera sp. TaxID=1869214 RepID=UPI000EEB482E|nr:GNAT family N-acetyltransferase [Rheinheimera sp.]HCU65942.1 N-acetyltransferase [Rheinheimera sp.]